MLIQFAKCASFKSITQKILMCRNLSSKVQETVKYTNTINLPKTKFPQRLSAQKRSELEDSIRKVSLWWIFNYLLLLIA
jgi:hypothetical protein